MSKYKVKAKKSPEIELRRKAFIRSFSERAEARLDHADKGRAAAHIGCSADTITNWLQSTLPDIFEAERFADFLGVRHAWLAFGELPQDRASDRMVTLIAEGLNRASYDTRRAALRVLNIDPDSIQPGTVIQSHIPTAMEQEIAAPCANAPDPDTMHRLCDQLIARMQNPLLPSISGPDLILYRQMISVILSVIERQRNGPKPPSPPGGPSAGNGTTPDEDPQEPDDGSDDDGATP